MSNWKILLLACSLILFLSQRVSAAENLPGACQVGKSTLLAWGHTSREHYRHGPRHHGPPPPHYGPRHYGPPPPPPHYGPPPPPRPYGGSLYYDPRPRGGKLLNGGRGHVFEGPPRYPDPNLYGPGPWGR